MTDFKRPGSHSGGIPPYVDPELTPPPSDPPPAHEVEQLTLEEQVALLHKTAAEQAAGLRRVWDSRNVADRVDMMIAGQAELLSMMRDVVHPTIRAHAAEILHIRNEQSDMRSKIETVWERDIPRLMKLLDGFDARQDRFELSEDRNARGVEQLDRRMDSTNADVSKRRHEQANSAQLISLRSEKADSEINERLLVLERENLAAHIDNDKTTHAQIHARHDKADERAEEQFTKLDNRLRAVEDARLISKTRIGLLIAGVSAVISAGAWFIEYVVHG